MREFNCIGCPRGCLLRAEEKEGVISVSGNACPRGRDFAVGELTRPMRTLCSTVKTAFSEAPVLPVRSSADIPKDRIFDVMKEINKVMLTERTGRGGIIIPDVLGLGVDIISTSDVLVREK